MVPGGIVMRHAGAWYNPPMGGRTLVIPFVGGTVIIAIGVVFDAMAATVIGALLMAGVAVLWRLSRG